MSNLSSKRSLYYWVFFGVFLLGGGPIMQMTWSIDRLMHSTLDGVALFASIIATFLVTRAYYRNKAVLLGLAAVALLGTVFLELLHVLATAENVFILKYISSTQENFVEWTWAASRGFLAIAMIMAVIHSYKEPFGSPVTRNSKRIPGLMLAKVVLVAALLVTIYALLQFEMQSVYFSQDSIARVPDHVAGTAFLVAILISIRLGNWRRDSYGHWLNIGLMASVCASLFVMGFSQNYLDASYAIAHGLKIVSYAAIAWGFMMAHQTSNEQLGEDTSKPRGLGLGAKVALLCGFIGFICVMPVAYKSSVNLHQISQANSFENLTTAAKGNAEAMERQRLRVDGDLDFLVGVAVALNMQDSENADNGVVAGELDQGLVNTLRNLLRSDPQYLSVSYVDPETGKAVFRAVRPGWDTKINQALYKTNERMLTKRALEAGDTKDSANRSKVYGLQSNFSERKVPVEAAAKIVYDTNTNAPIGVIVVNSDVSKALAPLQIQAINEELRLHDVDADLYVVNTGGRFVVHPDAEKQLARGATLETEFPGLDFADLSVPGYQFEMLDHHEGGEHEVLIGFSKPELTTGSGEALLYIYAADLEIMELAATYVGYELQGISQIILLIAIAIGWVFARRFSRPVAQVSAAAVEFGRTGAISELNTNGRDEIGMLANSLNDMMQEVSSQREKMVLLAAAIESSVDSTLITTNTGEIVYANPFFERYTGMKFEEVQGKNIMELPEFVANREMLHESTNGKKGDELVWTGEMRTRRNDGKLHDELVTIAPIRDTDGNVLNQTVMIEDITSRRIMERNIERKAAELQRSNRDLEQFAYVASHDLKAPLRAIEVLVGWLKDDLEEFEEGDVQENLDLLGRRTSRLARLLDDLLAYSRAGRKVGDIKIVNTKELVTDIGVLVNPPEGFKIEVDDNMPTIESYHAPLETVFRNLIGNGIKHSPVPEEGVIKITSRDAGDRVQFSVQDNGKGIPKEYADKVFKMFQTLQARDEKEGSGMGLAIVQRIIDWQGGKIWFEDGPDGKGTVFHFTWTKKPQKAPEIPNEDAMSQTQVLRAQAEAEAKEQEQQKAAG